jgi:hypothetical protein
MYHLPDFPHALEGSSMDPVRWRHRAAAPLVALISLAGGGAAALVSSAGSASAATPVTTEAEFRAAWANDADVVLGADISLTCVDQAGNGESEAVRDLAGAGSLDGQGFTITQTCPENRVLQITGSTGAMTIQNVTITGGEAVFGTFSGNGGGGIQSTVESALSVVNSTFTGNLTCEGGGGIEMDYAGPINVTNSTFSNNTADYGGGIAEYGTQATLVNSTITGNTAAQGAGGIAAEGDLNLVYSDVVGNTMNPSLSQPVCADAESQVQQADPHGAPRAAAPVGDPANVLTGDEDGTFTSFGSVVAKAIGGPNCEVDDQHTSLGYNYADDLSCDFDAATDNQVASNDPMLGALAANGGPTQTLLPQTGSPLIDAIPHVNCGDGDAVAETTILSDQRGFGRPEVSGGNCDIGAVEVQLPAPTPEAPPTPSPAVIVQPRFTG